MPQDIAYFVTPHGFGHATRAAAVMAALQKRDPSIHFHIVTQAAPRLFHESLPGTYTYHDILTDLGLVQLTPLEADLDASVQRLNTFLPFDSELIDHLAQRLQSCACICCDIAPLGIAVAQKANIPSILIENFTWDWIYEPYTENAPGFEPHITYLRDWFQSADHHIQTTPVCNPNPQATTVNPVSRNIQQPPTEVRNALDLPDNATTVMITMGGTPFQYEGANTLSDHENLFFLLPNSGDVPRRDGNLVHIPHNSPIFHPDLVNTSDIVISKVGYSITAEVYRAGTPIGYIPRPSFRESNALISFIQHHMPGLVISNTDFESGAWLKTIPNLLAQPHTNRTDPNGADQIAEYLIKEILL